MLVCFTCTRRFDSQDRKAVQIQQKKGVQRRGRHRLHQRKKHALQQEDREVLWKIHHRDQAKLRERNCCIVDYLKLSFE